MELGSKVWKNRKGCTSRQLGFWKRRSFYLLKAVKGIYKDRLKIAMWGLIFHLKHILLDEADFLLATNYFAFRNWLKTNSMIIFFILLPMFRQLLNSFILIFPYFTYPILSILVPFSRNNGQISLEADNFLVPEFTYSKARPLFGVKTQSF